MSDIATGLWFDNSRSSALGWTITLRTDDANLLLSGLTFLVTIAGLSCWGIAALALHGWKARDRAGADGVDLQLQVVLRNSGSPIRAVLDALKIHRAWSKSGGVAAGRLWSRTLFLAVPAVALWAGFAAASIFTSRVATSAEGSVLAQVREHDCGLYWVADSDDAFELVQEKNINQTFQARAYALDFYGRQAGVRSDRTAFPKSALEYTVDRAARCPIPDTFRCQLGADGAVSMETDFLDSHLDLGINARPADRISVKMKSACAPILVGDHVSNSSGPLTFDLGPRANNTDNYTWIYYPAAAGANVGFQLVAVSEHLNGWMPIKGFRRDDAGLSIHFLAQNSVRYLEPITDPWFKASRIAELGTPDAPITVYLADILVSVMVCADQVFWCNPSQGHCSEYAFRSAEDFEFNEAQNVTFRRLYNEIGWIGSIDSSSVFLGAGGLLASRHVASSVLSTYLPENQWQLEVETWFQTQLAGIQAAVIEYAYKTNTAEFPFNQSPYNYAPAPEAGLSAEDIAEYKKQCKTQLVQTAGAVQNFSLVGVLIVVVVSALLVLGSVALPGVLSMLDGRRRRRAADASADGGHHDAAGSTKYQPALARQADDKLHLLRIALEQDPDLPRWQPGAWDVPVTESGSGEPGRRQQQLKRPRVTGQTRHDDGLTTYAPPGPFSPQPQQHQQHQQYYFSAATSPGEKPGSLSPLSAHQSYPSSGEIYAQQSYPAQSQSHDQQVYGQQMYQEQGYQQHGYQQQSYPPQY